jgi:hypothetical protein
VHELAAQQSNELGGSVSARKCSLEACSGLVVTSFSQQDLCLDHFLSRCYEDLDYFEVKCRGAQLDRGGSARLKAFVAECSSRALEVSLQCHHLDNLQRGRLWDILLWAGELLPERTATMPMTL